MLESSQNVPVKTFKALDLHKLAREDALRDALPGQPKRFAVARPVEITPASAGDWSQLADGDWVWRLRVRGEGAAHLNFGFSRFALPAGASLHIVSTDGRSKVGPFTREHMLPHGQLWTPVVLGEEALLHLRVPASGLAEVELQLDSINQGYRGFGVKSKACKSGACNTDVACLSDGDPWNLPRRAVGAWTRGGTDTCTGSLLNNTANDRRMLFATATHCGVANDSAAATVLVYWNYESPTCRVPASSGSSPVLPKPSSTTQGLRFLAQTANPFSGPGAAGERSDFTLIELATPAPGNGFNLYWAGWDRRAPSPSSMVCEAPGDPASTAGLCASIHHPGVDEKRITFVESNLTLDSIASARDVHWRANWDPTPPRLPNISPMPASLPPSVTEPGSSGSPLYNAEQRLVGVLSGGPSACGATGSSLRDQYGGLFHAWEGLGSAATRMRDHLDPLGSAPQFIDGVGTCDPPAAPPATSASATAENQITVSWTAVAGADRYRIQRSAGSCPGGGFVQIGEVGGGTTAFVDGTVSGGSAYAYRVIAVDSGQVCPSAAGPCASTVATGSCALPPDFAGLASAESAGTAACAINLGWAAGSGRCGAGSALRYNVYRSDSPGFTPGPATLIESCRNATGLADVDVLSGATRYYAVRAEDIGARPANGRCGGVEDGNVVILAAAASGPDVLRFSDDVEAGSGNWTVSGSGAGADFAVVSSAASSPTRSWFVSDPDDVSDRQLSLVTPLSLAAGRESILEFAHRYQTEANFDGGVLEYSLDGGVNWSDILAAQGGVAANANRFLGGAYDGSLNNSVSNPLSGRSAWHGSIAGFTTSRVSLADFAGRELLLRFRFGSDSSVSGTGWWIDDIRLFERGSCQPASLGAIFADGFEG
ncbi:hypothetical protein [Pseudomarimonas salicorniae]|uniref:Fibronectin type-III domain-containing protein n=1 Tax=Pseudomarimonas salicorniae TaxID=2933270 RepID=A0ABT0GLU2_9GAMM|nr:hypothetical protein [Lysobacter sp. CAU 1642]MCK7595509.1 hypothetical protein [Lysobacter sp. CAU 1642]